MIRAKYCDKALVFFILILPCLSYSQPFVDIFSFKYQRFPSVKYVGNESENKKVSINQIIGNMNLPIPLKNKDVIITGVTYDQLQFTTNEKIQRNLYAIIPQLGYIKTWGKTKWKTLFMILPKLSSDNLRITRDAYQVGGILLFTYVKKDNLKYKIGMYYNREFFGNFFIPLVGLEWKPTERLNIFGVLPGNMNIEYKLNKKLFIGLSYQSITSSYRLHDNNIKSFVRNGARPYGHNQVRAFINFYPSKNIVLFAEAGYTFYRRFEAYESKKVTITHPVFTKTKDGMLLNAGIAFRVRL